MFGSSILYLIDKGLNTAFANWRLFKESRRELERSFRDSSRDGLRVEDFDNHGLFNQLIVAVLERADGIVFAERELHGLASTETKDHFWTLDSSDARDEPSAAVNDLEYFVRHIHMSRIDFYHIIQGDAQLRGGLPLVFRPHIDALRSCLRTPRRATLLSNGETIQCTFSLASEKRFCICSLLHVEISYSEIGTSAVE